MDQWNFKYVPLSTHNPGFILNYFWLLIVTLYRWYHDPVWQAFYKIHTHRVADFEISSSVPICYIAIKYYMTLFPVEHKEVKIRHNFLYVKM